MRLIGILVMAGVCVAVGFAAADRWNERLAVLNQLRQMVYHLKNQILYTNAALPEALAETGLRFTGSGAELFLKTAERLKKEKEKNLEEIWTEEAEAWFCKEALARKDLENLLTLGKQLGYADRSMQERVLLFYLEQTDDSIVQIKDEIEGRTRLFRCLGMTAGAFLVILLA